jgi:hypothetical protein
MYDIPSEGVDEGGFGEPGRGEWIADGATVVIEVGGGAREE